jgi:hypothetical protein
MAVAEGDPVAFVTQDSDHADVERKEENVGESRAQGEAECTDQRRGCSREGGPPAQRDARSEEAKAKPGERGCWRSRESEEI